MYKKKTQMVYPYNSFNTYRQAKKKNVFQSFNDEQARDYELSGDNEYPKT